MTTDEYCPRCGFVLLPSLSSGGYRCNNCHDGPLPPPARLDRSARAPWAGKPGPPSPLKRFVSS
jgi:hypothetical protein